MKQTKTKQGQSGGRAATPLYINEAIPLIENLLSRNKESLRRIAVYGSVVIYTGLRYSDVKLLTWGNFKQGAIHIREQKTGKIREIFLDEIGFNLIMKCKPLWAKDNTPILATINDEGITNQGINKILARISKEYNLSTVVTTHSFRKVFALCIYEMNNQSEAGLILLSKILRHSNISTTRRYIGLEKESIKEAYMNLSGMYNKQSESKQEQI